MTQRLGTWTTHKIAYRICLGRMKQVTTVWFLCLWNFGSFAQGLYRNSLCL